MDFNVPSLAGLNLVPPGQGGGGGGGYGGGLFGAVSDAWGTISNTFSNAFSTTGKNIQGAAQGLSDIVSTPFNGANEGSPIDDIGNLYRNAGNEVANNLGKPGQAYVTGYNNVFGELSGSNFQRQQDWQNQVTNNANAALVKSKSDANAFALQQDTQASEGIQGIKNTALARAQAALQWNTSGAGSTKDFLGL